MANPVLLSRRNFLAASSATALAFGTAARAKPILRVVPRTPSDIAWKELARRMTGPVVRPGDPDYLKLSLPDNLRYASNLPAGIARCMDAQDVSTAIRWSRENDIALITRSGGHSYAGYSTTTGLMIDMRLMDDIGFDPATGIVTVAGGARNEPIYEALNRAGVTLTHGRCPSVGAAAFLLGGGIGFNMRQYGLACDQVKKTELVKADGTILAMSETQNDREFWACRGGGGGNFGISTSFSIQTVPVPDRITVFEMIWETGDPNIALALMEALAAAPDTLGSRVSIVSVNPTRQSGYKGIKIDLLGQLKGTREELSAILKNVPAPTQAKVEYLPYWKGQDFLAEPPAPTYYQERSAFVDTPVPKGPIAVGFQHFLNVWPRVAGNCDLRFFQTGKAVNAVAPEKTAFVHRSSQWLMVIGLYWNEQDNRDPTRMAYAHDWQDRFYQAVLPFSDGGAYQNFPDPSLGDWRQAYYKQNLGGLVKIKRELDPTRVFNFAQAIPSV